MKATQRRRQCACGRGPVIGILPIGALPDAEVSDRVVCERCYQETCAAVAKAHEKW